MMNKLKTALLVSATLLATSAQAQWQGNWLLGVSGSYAWFDNDDNDDDNGTGFLLNGVTTNNFDFANNDDSNNNGWGWGLLGGYQARCNGWLLGVELAIDWLDGDDDNNNNNGFAFTSVAPGIARNWIGDTSWDTDYVVGLTGRMGYEVTPYFMPYLRAGVETSRDEVSFAIITNGGNPVIAGSGDGHRQSWRFVGGIGAEVPVPVVAGMSVRAEWNYHSDGRSTDATALLSDNATLVSVGGSQSMNTAKVSLVFNFPA